MERALTLVENLIADLVPPEELRERGRRALAGRKRGGHTLKARLDDLECWLGELTLLNETTLRLLLARKVFTVAELRRSLQAVDLLDGIQDGKLTKKKAAPMRTKARKGRRSGR